MLVFSLADICWYNLPVLVVAYIIGGERFFFSFSVKLFSILVRVCPPSIFFLLKWMFVYSQFSAGNLNRYFPVEE